ncbi:MAG: 50S ribosomal protein L13 [Thermoplasmataceae archaeon]
MSTPIYIDGTKSIYGKISAYVAKKLLEGEEIVIVNANEVIVTGGREFVLGKFRERRDIGSVRKGPYYPRTSDQILRRSIAAMLPRKSSSGKEALSKCTVYAGVPRDLKNAEFQKVEKAVSDKVNGFVTLAEVSRHLGAKVRN